MLVPTVYYIYIALLAGTVALPFLFLRLFDHPAKFPDTVPIVGLRKQLWSVARSSLRQLTCGIVTLLDGYSQFAQHGNPFVVYDPSGQQELLLPVKDLKWFSEQSDTRLSSHGVRQERHAVRYLKIGIDLDKTMSFIKLISRDRLARNLDVLQVPMYDELIRSIDKTLGTSEEWSSINAYESMQEIVLPVMYRVLLGLPLCRESRLVTALDRYVMAMGLGTIFVGELPRPLKVIAAPLVNLPLAYYRKQALGIIAPIVRLQMAATADEQRKESSEGDFIRQCAKLAEKSTVDSAGDADTIAEMIMAMVFAGSTSTVSQGTNLLLDIVNSANPGELIEDLRQEAAKTLPNEDAWHQTQSFADQYLCDSAIRETLRFHPIMIKGLTRQVVPHSGIELPDGTKVPQGVWIGVPVLGIHRDERYWPQAYDYDPYRCVKQRSVNQQDNKVASSWQDEVDAVKPSTTYLGFGYGRHACPGRWLAVLMLKMIVSYIVLNYDIESDGAAPTMKVIGDASLPPLSARIKVKRTMTGKTRGGVVGNRTA